MEHKKTESKREQSKILVGTRGRTFEGFVTKKFATRVVVEFERTVFVPKYERYYKKKTRLHARLPEGMNVEIGDYIRVRECRPLSKIIHFIVLNVIKKAAASEPKEKAELKLKEETKK